MGGLRGAYLKECPLFEHFKSFFEDVNTFHVFLYCFRRSLYMFSVFFVEMFLSGDTLAFVPELNFCSVSFFADKYYCMCFPVHINHLFCIKCLNPARG